MKGTIIVVTLMSVVGLSIGCNKQQASQVEPLRQAEPPNSIRQVAQTEPEPLTKARHANDQPAELPIKVLSVAWKGPLAGLWQPTFVVRNDGPTTQLVSIEYQVFDGEVLVGSGVLLFDNGIPSNTIAKEDGIHVNSETRPTKLKVVRISWKD